MFFPVLYIILFISEKRYRKILNFCHINLQTEILYTTNVKAIISISFLYIEILNIIDSLIEDAGFLYDNLSKILEEK